MSFFYNSPDYNTGTGLSADDFITINILIVSGSATIDGDLTVNGTSTFNGVSTFNAPAIFNNDIDIKKSTGFFWTIYNDNATDDLIFKQTGTVDDLKFVGTSTIWNDGVADNAFIKSDGTFNFGNSGIVEDISSKVYRVDNNTTSGVWSIGPNPLTPFDLIFLGQPATSNNIQFKSGTAGQRCEWLRQSDAAVMAYLELDTGIFSGTILTPNIVCETIIFELSGGTDIWKYSIDPLTNDLILKDISLAANNDFEIFTDGTISFFNSLGTSVAMFINPLDNAFVWSKTFKIKEVAASNRLDFMSLSTPAPSNNGIFRFDTNKHLCMYNTLAAYEGIILSTRYNTIETIAPDASTGGNGLIFSHLVLGVPSPDFNIQLNTGNDLVIDAVGGEDIHILNQNNIQLDLTNPLYFAGASLSTLYFKQQLYIPGGLIPTELRFTVGQASNIFTFATNNIFQITNTSYRPFFQYDLGGTDAGLQTDQPIWWTYGFTANMGWRMGQDSIASVVNNDLYLSCESYLGNNRDFVVFTDGIFRVQEYSLTKSNFTLSTGTRAIFSQRATDNIIQLYCRSGNENKIQFGQSTTTPNKLIMTVVNNVTNPPLNIIRAGGSMGIVESRDRIYGYDGADQTVQYAAATDTNFIPFTFDSSFAGTLPQQETEYFEVNAGEDAFDVKYDGYADISGVFTFQVNFSSFAAPTNAEKYAYSIYILCDVIDSGGTVQHTVSSGFAPHGDEYSDNPGVSAWITTAQIPTFNCKVYNGGEITFNVAIYRGTGGEPAPPTDLSVLAYLGGTTPLAWGSSLVNLRKTNNL